MRPSHLSIDRPVFTWVLSLFLMVLGIIALPFLGIREFPAVDPPSITVNTYYPGANAGVVETQITQPLEQSVNGVDGIRSLTSVSREGRSSITVEFNLGSDLNIAANDVRDRVARVVRNLPADVDPPVVAKADANAYPILLMTVQSDSRTILETNEIGMRIQEQLQTIPGVAEVRIWGEKKYAIRIRLDPGKLSAHNLTFADVATAFGSENVELPSGTIQGDNTELTVMAQGKLRSPEEFNRMILRSDGDALVRLEDVGEARLGAENERSILKRDGIPMIGLAVIAQPGANSLAIGNEFFRRFERIKSDVPPDIHLKLGFDGTKFVRRSLHEVGNTIAIAFLLVLFVLFFFLRDWRTAMIPLLAIPVSLIGTLFLLFLAGYTINVLTLLGLVLAIGLVVDDAIVVLENIYRKIEAGEEPKLAGYAGTEEIFFAVVSTTTVLAVVFLPLLFIPGFAGRLFREFGLAVAGSVFLSALVSLTLTPMLSTRILRRSHSRLYTRTEPGFQIFYRAYGSLLQKFLRRRWAAFAVLAATVVGIFVVLKGLKSEQAPVEDRNQIDLVVTGPEGASFGFMDRLMDKLTDIVNRDAPEISAMVAVTSPGFSASGSVNSGFMRLFLSSAEQRKRSQKQVAEVLGKDARGLTDARIILIQSPTISTTPVSGLPVQFILEAPDFEHLAEALPRFLEEARKDKTFAVVDENLKFTRPELQVTVDRDRLRSLGVPYLAVARALQLAFGEVRIGYFLKGGRQYQVISQVDDTYRRSPDDLKLIPVRGNDGKLIPLGNLVDFHEKAGPPALYRFNRSVAATVSAGLAPGMVMGDGVAAMRRIAAKTLDPSFSTDLAGQARDFAESSSSLLWAGLLALLLIYLVLAAQFESFRDPVIILITVPLALFGALLALRVTGQTLNIFSEIGIIMLIGLVTKNGILIVEFTRQKREKGMQLHEAVVEAAQARLRPILMTTLTAAFGMMPIALALGAGAESRRPMGITVAGGLVFGMVLTLFVIPAMILLFHGAKAEKTHA